MGNPTSYYNGQSYTFTWKNGRQLAFAQRRKTFVNAVSSKYPKDKIAEALEAAGMRADIRGERLTPRDFCMLADLLNR